MRKIYVASSWRNRYQHEVITFLRNAGHEVYDFKNPIPGNHGFNWSEIDPNWQTWSNEMFRSALSHPIANRGFSYDWGAMLWADTCILVMPCGRSAHIEAGYFVGAGKKLIILIPCNSEPELMYKMSDHICLTIEEVALKLS